MKAPNQPDLFIVVGPNGSGKSSALYLTHIDDSLIFVNPDDVARNEFSHVEDEGERNRLAWESCNNQREALLIKKVSFGFETVGSHISKVELLEKAKTFGYKVILLFVATENPQINIERIKHRVLQGGHGVPDDKVRARYRRTLELLPKYFEIADIATIWDNSLNADGAACNTIRELVRKDSDGSIRVLPAAADVEWIQKYLVADPLFQEIPENLKLS